MNLFDSRGDRPLTPQQRRFLEQRISGKAAASVSTSPIQRRPRGKPAPLAFTQRRLYAIQRALPGASLFHIQQTFRLAGPLDASALAAAIQEIANRHENLRTTFHAGLGGDFLRISRRKDVTAEAVDLSAGSPAEALEAARCLLATEAAVPFDVEAGPLWRTLLVKLAPQDHILQLTLHHLIADGYSLYNLTRELLALYEAFRRGEASPLRPLPIQYADFAYWQANGAKTMAANLEYWQRALAAETPPVRSWPSADLLADRSPVRIAESTVARLKTIAVEVRATLFMALLAGIAILLAARSGEDDIWIATLAANRDRPELEPLIGLLVNTLVLRAFLPQTLSFRQALVQVREATLAAYEHQDAPFEMLLEKTPALARGNAVARLPVMFVLQNTPRLALPAHLELQPAALPQGESRIENEAALTTFALSFALTEVGGAIEGWLLHRRAALNAGAAHDVVELYNRFLGRCVEHPDDAVARLL